jgi:hypothetical protein
MVRRRTPPPPAEGGQAGGTSQEHPAPTDHAGQPQNGPAAEPAAEVRNGANGATTRPPEAAASPKERAEEIVDHLAERIGHYAGLFGHKILWLAARAREEAEDIWAEAQALRRGQ